MCGICGFVFTDAARPPDGTVLTRMRDAMAVRGPDDAGTYLAPGIALGTRRLKILDLSDRGHMPMCTADGRYWITYNGEVYNFRELRRSLETRGYRFRSDTDTEVVLSLFADRGAAMLDELNGMFAFGIWDAHERRLFVARDRLGVKPLFYIAAGNRLAFASEIKALLAAGHTAAFDPDCWEELLCFRYAAGERTPYLGVRRLLPGHFLIWKEGHLETHRWWRLDARARTLREQSPADPTQWFQSTFDDAVTLRRISDVPIGVLLSGGLDSSSVAASLAGDSSVRISSFTVRFAEPEYDEGPLAQEVVARWGLDAHELTLSGRDVWRHLRRISLLNDEPLAHGSDLHLWAIADYAKRFVTVLLSGEGADETLGGYVRYRPLQFARLLAAGRPLVSLLASGSGARRVQKLARFLGNGSIDNWVLHNACDVLPSELTKVGLAPRDEFLHRRTVLGEARALYPREPIRQAMYADQHTFLVSLLDRNDRMTMGASIECRVPFLDYRLVEGLAALPTRQLLGKGWSSKRLLRRSLGDRLPRTVLRARKWGFGVPWAVYLRGIPELRDTVERLPDTESIRHGPFDVTRVRDVARRFLAGEDELASLVRQLVLVSVWHEASFETTPDTVTADEHRSG
jgi:asparagine synthase (glutamine-hydrolysing)